jgi:hypothetical protein
MEISKERLEELRRIFKEDFKADLTDQELHEAAFNLTGFYGTLAKMASKDIDNFLRLEKEPDGWPINVEWGTCSFCGCYMSMKESWFDKFGYKCKFCQRALREGVIPSSVCRNKGRRFSFDDLRDMFGIHQNTARSLVRKGELKARVILNDAGKPHFTVFLREDNYKFLKIEKDAPVSELEEYDQQVAKWAEDYKQRVAEQNKTKEAKL